MRAPGAALEDAALWAAHEHASASLKESGARAERVAATVARQRAYIEGAAERASLVAARSEGLGAGTARINEALERLGVVALNAGLEGARAGESQGRALLLLSEEIRANVVRGADAAAEMARTVDEIASESAEVRRQIERSRFEVSEVGQEAAQLQVAAAAASKSLDDLGARLRRATGIDPEMARVAALAAEHARGLMTALSALSTAAHPGPVLTALRPVIGPLVRLLGELDEGAPSVRPSEPGGVRGRSVSSGASGLPPGHDRGRPPDPSAGDPEIARLLLDELHKHAPALEPGAPEPAQRRAVHALKGSAGIAGARELSDSLARIERRLLAGDPLAARDARAVVAEVTAELAAGRPPAASSWPEPPADLRAVPLDAALAARYRAEMADRIARVDGALATSDDDLAATLAAFRDVHAMKGAALAVGDEVTAWFCHGLEERLRAGQRSEEAARNALAELTRWRGVLAELTVAPERALETLRLLARLPRGSRPTSRSPPLIAAPPLVTGDALVLPPAPMRHPPAELPADAESRGPVSEDASLRVPTATLDRLFERVRLLGQSRGEVVDGALMAGSLAVRARSLRLDLAEALRLIGPPKPWGAPAAAIRRVEQAARELGHFADRLERGAAVMKETAERVRVESAGAHGDLATMRTVRVGWLFERVAAAVSAQARREGQEVRLIFSGEENAIDRRVAEQLFDPVLQLARNAVTHGIEPAPERAMRGKRRVGSVRLLAQPRSGGLRLVVQDDGAGVDVADVRRRAVARGTISADTASAADDQTLLSLLFVPGFTTRDSADLLAGRGVGLDLALEAVHRLGGTIRLASRSGVGLTATLDVPFEPGLLKVLWLEAEGATFALPIQQARRILLGRDPEAAGAVPLLACVSGPASSRSRTPFAFAIELEPARDDAPPPLIGVDRIGTIEEVALRSVSPLVARGGPYAGAIVRGADLRLCLDAHALAEAADRAR